IGREGDRVRQGAWIARRRRNGSNKLAQSIIAADCQQQNSDCTSKYPQRRETCLHQHSAGTTGLNAESLNYCEGFIVQQGSGANSRQPSLKPLKYGGKGRKRKNWDGVLRLE